MSELIRWSLVGLGLSTVAAFAIAAAVQAVKNAAPVRSCRACGCTDERSCPGGCWWELPDVCSACVAIAVETDRWWVAR